MSAEPEFFIGWRSSPGRAARFALAAGLSAAALLVLGALALAPATSPHAGDILGEAEFHGVLAVAPYPHLRIAADATHPDGHDVLLSGDGKYGIEPSAETALAGRNVSARGLLVRRGDLDMLIVAPGDALRADDAPTAAATLARAVPLGRWRVAGEICDGKCTTGIMRPGDGLAHKACASLCVSGGVPPVFVAAAPAAGHVFFLIAARDGGPEPETMIGFIASPVTLEGDIERSEDLPVFRVNWSRVAVR